MVDMKRRTALKRLGAFGVVGVLGACNDGSSPNTTSSLALGDVNPAPGGSLLGQGGSTPGKSLIIDASVAATGIPEAYPIYAYITGLVKVPGEVYYRYDPVAKKPVQMSIADNIIKSNDDYQTALKNTLYTQNYPEPWANYSISLSRTGPTVAADLSSFNSTNIPGYGSGDQAFSGRIWISVGKPLIPFIPRGNPGATTGYTTPIVTENGFGSLCFFDWLEFSFDVNSLLFINTTQVDQYGFPISINATGSEVRNGIQGLYTKKRSEIIDALGAETNALFNTSIAIPDGTNVDSDAYPQLANTHGKLRALSPYQIPKAKDNKYLDEIIKNTLEHWKTAWLEVTCPSNALQKTYYGFTAADGKTLNFYKTRTLGDVVFAFNDITTYNVLACAGSLAGKDVDQVGDLLGDMKNTGKAILAGYNRGVLDTTTTIVNIDANGGNYTPPISQNYTSLSTPYNTWAKRFHEFSENGLAYAFAYDDVGDQEPSLVALNTTSLTLTLGKFE